MADNLKTTQAINNLLTARQALIQETNKELTKQVALQRDLCNAIECADTDTFENLRNHMKDAAQAAAEGEKDFNKLNNRINSGTKEVGKFERAIQKVKGGLKGMVTFMNVGIAGFLGMLSKAYQKLVDTLYKVIDQQERVAQSVESIRGQFGDVDSGVGKMVLSDSRAVGQALAKMGVSAGYAFDATINLQKAQAELVGAMDAGQLSMFSGQTEEARVNMTLMSKAMGYAGGELGQLGLHFRAMGENAESALMDVNMRSGRLAKVLGITKKAAAKGFAAMIKDVKAFGNASRKQMEVAMAKATQLGISIKDLSGISDSFFTFDQAAENVSKLSQAFGTQINVMDMVSASSPADQLDILRKSMFAAGQASENMSRHQLALLSQQTGLSMEAAKLAFSTEAQTMSQDELNDALKDTDPQKQMVDSMKQVARELENVIVKLSQLTDGANLGPLGIFFKGIQKELSFTGGPISQLSSAFSKMAHEVFGLGEGLGKFINESELAKDVTKSLKSAIEAMPAIFKKISEAIQKMLTPLNNAYKSFKLFFGEADPAKREKHFKDMASSIKSAFKGLFDDLFGSPGAKDMGSKIGEFLSLAWNEVGPRLKEMIGKAATAALDWFNSQDAKTQLGIAVVALAPVLMSAVGTLIGTILGALVTAIPKLLFRGLKGLPKMVKGLTKRLGRLPVGFRGLGRVFSMLGRGLGFVAKRFPIITAIISAIKPLIGLFGDISKRFQKIKEEGTGFAGFFAELPGMFSDVLGRAGEFILRFVNNFTFGIFGKFLDPEGFKERWDGWMTTVREKFDAALPKLMELGGNIVNAIKSGISAAWTALTSWLSGKFDSLTEPLQTAFDYWASKLPGGRQASPEVNQEVDAAAEARRSASDIQLAIDDVTAVGGNLDRLRSTSEEMQEVFTQYASTLSGISEMFAGTGSGSVDVDVLTGRLAKVGEAMARMTAALADVDTATLRAKIEEVAGTALFGDDTIETNKFVINLNVTMDADDVARVMVRNNLVVAP